MSALIPASQALGWPGSLRAALAGGGARLSVPPLVADASLSCAAGSFLPTPGGWFGSFAMMPEEDPWIPPAGGVCGSTRWLGLGVRGDTRVSPAGSCLKQLVQHKPYVLAQCINKGFQVRAFAK